MMMIDYYIVRGLWWSSSWLHRTRKMMIFILMTALYADHDHHHLDDCIVYGWWSSSCSWLHVNVRWWWWRSHRLYTMRGFFVTNERTDWGTSWFYELDNTRNCFHNNKSINRLEDTFENTQCRKVEQIKLLLLFLSLYFWLWFITKSIMMRSWWRWWFEKNIQCLISLARNKLSLIFKGLTKSEFQWLSIRALFCMQGPH